MPLRLDDKKAIVADVSSIVSKAVSVVAADYRGLTSAQMTDLRARARKSGIKLKVVRNTLARRAFKDTPYENMGEILKGPVILAFSNDEPGANARLLREFAKEHEKLEVVALSLGNEVLGKEHLNRVANLPNREQALTKLVCVMQAPIAKFVRTLAEPHAKLVRTVAAVRDKKQAEGG